MLNIRTVHAAVLLILPLSPVAVAQQNPADQQFPSSLKQLSLEQLSAIEVTSPTKEPVPAMRSPVAIYVITGEDIRRSGATTLPDALRLAPGVEVARIDGSKWSVGIRGFGTRLSRSVLVLIDGRSVYTPLVAGTYWEVQDTLLEDVDRIEVIRGPGGAIWGPDAVNGVINIITKSARETLGGYASAGGGSVEKGFANARYGGGNPDGLSWRVYGKGYTRGPEYHPDGDNFDAWRGAQGGFRFDWAKSPSDSLTLQGDLYEQEDNERVNAATYVPPANLTLDGPADVSGGNVLFRWKRTMGSGSDFQLQAYYDRTNRYEPNLGENRDTFDIDMLSRTRLSDRQELLYGFGARASRGHFLEAVSGLVFDPAHRTDYLISGFLEDDVDLIHGKLALDLGGKFLRTNYTGFAAEPSVRLLFTPSDRQTLWASFTHAVRTPSDAEEDFYLSSYVGLSNGVEYFARFNPNKNFAPEQLNGYEAGYRRLLAKGLYVDIAGFLNRHHDLFSQDLTGAPALETTLPFPEANQPPPHLLLPAAFQNDLYGLTSGGEIAPEWRPTSFWRLRGSYSYLHMNLKQPATILLGEGPGMVDGSSPPHEITIDSSLNLGKNLQVDLLYRYVSPLTALKVPAYHTGDVHAAWRLNDHVEFSVTGQNLFQPYHVEYAGDPGPPVAIRRNVYATLAWRSK